MRVKGDLLVICERLMTFYLDTVTFQVDVYCDESCQDEDAGDTIGSECIDATYKPECKTTMKPLCIARIL